MKLEEQVMTLKGRFAAPLVVRLLTHKAKSASEDDKDHIADCCQAAKATMHGALVAAASSGGINGVVQYFTTDFKAVTTATASTTERNFTALALHALDSRV